MAKEKDIFAPPTADEAAIFAPPTETEQNDIFAPPSESELGQAPAPVNSILDAAGTAGNTAIGGATGLAVAEGTRRLAEHALPGIAEDMAYRGIGGRTTPVGKKFYVESVGQNVPADMVNITPKTIGRQVLDENILGTFGMAGPEAQLIKQREVSAKKAGDKARFLSGFDKPDAIDKAALLKEYNTAAGIPDLNPTLAIHRQVRQQFNKDAPFFQGNESILQNEEAKSTLQSRVNYDGTGKEVARQTLDKAQAEARRKASEDVVKKLKGQDALDEFRALKQRSGNASVAEDIIARNLMTDSSNLTPNEMPAGGATKFFRELIGEKAPAVLAKGADALGAIAKSPVAKKLIPGAGLLLGGMAGANAAEEAGLSPSETAAVSAGEAVNPVPFTDVTKGYVAGKEEYNKSGSPIKAAGAAVQGYASPGTQALDSFGKSQSNDARSRMAQNMGAKPEEKKQLLDFTQTTPEELENLATMLNTKGGSAALYSGPLTKAAQADDRQRSAILYGLYQQPAFRSLLKRNEEEQS